MGQTASLVLAMTKISVKDMLDRHAASAPKIWAHDRAMSVGASEIGQCLRKTWFAKNGVAPDASYLDRYGAKLRGDLIERHHWEPGIRSQLATWWSAPSSSTKTSRPGRWRIEGGCCGRFSRWFGLG